MKQLSYIKPTESGKKMIQVSPFRCSWVKNRIRKHSLFSLIFYFSRIIKWYMCMITWRESKCFRKESLFSCPVTCDPTKSEAEHGTWQCQSSCSASASRDADFGTEIDRIQEFNKLRLTFLLLLIVSFFSLLKNSFIICRTFQTLPSILWVFFKNVQFLKVTFHL